MRILRYSIMAACIALGAVNTASARVDIDINLSLFPELVPVPGYPVYYAPRENWNYFFYDGMYWVYEDDGWYTSNWYDGPWEYVEPEFVPVYVLRVPVRYYRRPPPYFHGWIVDAPPRWGDRWGNDWVRRRSGWDHWDRQHVPRPAPLPVYQRNYSGDRYPRGEQQREIREQNYHYQPHNAEVRKHYQEERERAPQQHQRDNDRPQPQKNNQEQNNDKEQHNDRQAAPQNNRSYQDERAQQNDRSYQNDRTNQNDRASQNNRSYQSRPPQERGDAIDGGEARPARDRQSQQPSQSSQQQPSQQQPSQQQWQQREQQQRQHQPQPAQRDSQPQRESQPPQRESRSQEEPQQRQQRPFIPQQQRQPGNDAEHAPQHNERGQDAGREHNGGRERGSDDGRGDRDK